MYCKQCGKEIPDDSRFCLYCGTDNSEVAVAPTIQEKANTPSVVSAEAEENKDYRKKKTPWFLYCLLGLMLVVAIAYAYSYSSAKSAAINGYYTLAEQKLIVPAITELHDKNLKAYIHAGKDIDEKKYLDAYAQFETLASVGYADSKEKFDKLKETMYQEAISMYRKGEKTFIPSEYYKIDTSNLDNIFVPNKYFELLSDYKDAEHYLLLTKAASSGKVTDREYNSLLSSLDFEDTKEVLLANTSISKKFLLGSWKTSDGKWEFRMEEDSSSSNLPKPALEGDRYYTIENGLYYICKSEISNPTPEQIKEGSCYKIKILDEQTISVFCYQDGNTYIMTRQ